MSEATEARPRIERALHVRLLRCPACGETSPQKLVNRDRVQVFSLPDDPFARGFGWNEGTDAPEDSPLHHGLCLCPECRYPALPADFDRGVAANGGEFPGRAALHRLFVDQQAGLRGPIALILGAAPEVLSPARRAVRVALAAIAAQHLRPHGLERARSLARLHARLAWLYFDEERLRWKAGPRIEPPLDSRSAAGPASSLERRDSLASARTVWQTIPLEETAARAQAVAAQEGLCAEPDSRGGESAGEEHRRLALLLGFAGEAEEAAAAYRRALDLCLESQAVYRDTCHEGRRQGLSPAELRPAAEAAERLGRLAEEINLEAHQACGTPLRRIPRLRLPAALLGRDLEDLPRDLGLFD